MSEGQLVTVRLYGGGTAVRRVLSVAQNVIEVCSEEEYQSAKREGREPLSLGFPIEDVIDSESIQTHKKDPGRIGLADEGRSSRAGD
jgi:hypothetical protein